MAQGATPKLLDVAEPIYCRCCPNKSPMIDKPTLCPICKATYHNGCAKKCAIAANGGYSKCCGSRNTSPARPQQVILSKEDLDEVISAHFVKFTENQKDLRTSVNQLGLSMDNISQEQRAMRQSLDNAVTDLSKKLESTTKRCAEIALKSNETETKVNNLQGQVDSLGESVATLKLTVENSAGNSESEARMMREVEQRCRRALNIRLFDVPETGNDRATVINLLQPLNIRVDCIHATRLGARPPEAEGARPRALLVTLGSWADVNLVMRNRANLKLGDRIIPVGADRTEMQKDQLKNARADLERRKQAGEQNLTIKYRQGVPQVITIDPRAEPKN